MGQQEETDVSDLSGPAWVRFDDAVFQMGSAGGRDDVRPVHEVRLSGFRFSRFPITNKQYAIFVAETGADAPEHWPGGVVPADSADHPVTYVSWQEAQAFCGWLTAGVAAADADAVASGGAHLPTEAQWEFAARGVEGREYPWGDDPPRPELANYRESAIEETTPVATHTAGATPEGVHGLAGNVRHWCLDWYARYQDGPQEDPAGPEQGRERVVRGGSFLDAPGTLRGTYRFNVDPAGRFGFVGFHVAWSSHGRR
jgi:formylglycine-generating enzyme required for sulfatase activity